MVDGVGTDVDVILERAAARGRHAGLPYRGAVTPREAFDLMQAGAAKLVDVRSQFEWDYVGHIPGTTLVEWKFLPSGELNPNFLTQLALVGRHEDNLMFLCRSGARSHAAAVCANQFGYVGAFNVLEGFEGDLDASKHRGAIGGWRFAGLPWVQG